MTAGMKIHVLIIDEIAETRENLRKLLQFENDVEVVGVAATGKLGIEAARDLKPDVVLIDIHMPDMDGIAAAELIRSSQPATQIIILSVHGDPNDMRRAMSAGARDFLSKPPAIDELISAIRRAGRMAHDERAKTAPITPGLNGNGAAASSIPAATGKIIVVYSPKGGCGATMLAVNLAISLINDETRVALVDSNLQYGDSAVFLNEQVRNSILDLASRADELDAEIVEEVMISHKSSGLKVLAAPPRPEYAENVTGEQFVKVLQFLRRLFTYVVVDASTMLTDAVLGAMDASEVIVLITTQEIPAIKSARLFLNLAQVLKIDRKRVLFVLNRFDKRFGILPEKISESFKHEIVAVIPFDERVVVPSINRGIPFMLTERAKPVSKSILALADMIKQRITELDAVSVSKPGTKTR